MATDVSQARTTARTRRHFRLRKKVVGSATRPRLVVTRSARHIGVQLVDDTVGQTLASASTLEADLRAGDGDKTAKARKVGELIAERAKAAGCRRGRFRSRRRQVPRPHRGTGRWRPWRRPGVLTT